MNILFLHLDNIILCPPAINVLENLLDQGHTVKLMSYNADQLDKELLGNNALSTIDLGRRVNPKNQLQKYALRYKKRGFIRKYLQKYRKDFDLIWATSEITVRECGVLLLDCKYVMQLMELVNYVPLFGNQTLFQFDIAKYARAAYKVVVPEYNRAHIIKARWELDKLPTILPNKPYRVDLPGEHSKEATKIITMLKNERRKILLYQGGFTPDRRFEEFAEAARLLGDDYVLYLMGFENDYCCKILKEYPHVKYLGALKPPEHLLAAQYAYIGILTYIPVKVAFYSEMNALYCAPNKIYEYALCDLPMIGTDVPGISRIFDKFHIGMYCKELTAVSIAETVKKIEANYDACKLGRKKFYDDVDLKEIVKRIVEE